MDEEESLLYHAVVENNPEKLAELLDNGADVDKFYEDTMNISSKSLLHICCGKGHVECLKVLVEYGAQLDVRDKWGQTPLMYSVSIQFPELVKVLVEANTELVGGQDRFGKAPLHCAVETGSEELVRLLLDYGADLNIRNHEGMTPLMMCCVADPEDLRAGVLTMLLETGALIHLSDFRGRRTALHVAVVSGNVKAVETLIAAGANVNELDKTLRTPITLAIFSGVRGPEINENYERIISLLVSAGAELNMTLSESCNPLMTAALLKSEPMVRYFLSLGTDPNIKFSSRVTPPLVAASTGDLATLKTLIYYNSDLTTKGNVYKRRRRIEYVIDPFELAYMEGHLNQCVLMAEAGYRIHGKAQTFNSDLKLALSSPSGDVQETQSFRTVQMSPEEYQSALEWLAESACQPRTMREEAIFVIRAVIGRRLVNGVETLPLPQSVKNSILLTHFVT